MIICPVCNSENIPGADACEECGQPLSDSHLHAPATRVEKALLTDRLEVLARREHVVVSPLVPVGEVLKKLAQQSVGCALVVDHEKLVGIFTERDALRKLNVDFAALAGRPIAEFMTAQPESLQTSAKIAFAVQRMDLGGYRHIPLVDGAGKTAGVISVRDILKYLTEKIAD